MIEVSVADILASETAVSGIVTAKAALENFDGSCNGLRGYEAMRLRGYEAPGLRAYVPTEK